MSESPKAVFLSYAREDTDAARRIAEALRGFGIEVWFDQSELRGGDSWDAKIKKQIRECALFLPLVSAQTEQRGEGYFRREWKIAIDRTQDMGSSRAFIVPVVIDATLESGADVPEEFMRYQWTRLTNGEPTPEFVSQVKRLLDGPKKPSLKADHVRPPTLPPHLKQAGQKTEDSGQKTEDSRAGRKSAVPGWMWGVLGIVLIGVAVGVVVLRPSAPNPAVAASASEPKQVSANPSPKTQNPEPAAAPAADKSIAVLAFADLSEARNSEYFSDGISEELLNVLAKVPGLRVAARTSAFFFKGKNLPIPEIAAKLNVAYVVEGSVQRAGDRVKITAQLIKAADGYHLWSESFTRDAKDVFAVQEEIAGRIAQELSLKLGISSVTSVTAVKPEALELYLRARQAWNLRTTEGYAQAEAALKQAIALEPNFARAYVLLAQTWTVRDSGAGVINRSGQRTSPAIARIQAQIDRALALEPTLAEAHAAQANLSWNSWQLAEGAREARLAIALNPNDATAHQVLGRVLISDGWLDEADAALSRAAELDPLSHRILDNRSIPLRLAGRYEEALAFDERALALQPNSLQANVWKVLDLSGLGRHDEAVALLRRLPLDDTIYLAFGMSVFVKAGLTAEAEKLLPRVSATHKFAALARLGRPEEALAALDPATLSIQIATDLFGAYFDPIRSDPRFVNLIATLGLTEQHARTQAWRAAHPLSQTK